MKKRPFFGRSHFVYHQFKRLVGLILIFVIRYIQDILVFLAVFNTVENYLALILFLIDGDGRGLGAHQK